MKVFVRVKTQAKRAGVVEIDATHFAIAVTVPPIEGRANHAAMKALAKFLDVAPSRITLTSGAKSRDKVFSIT